MTPFRMPYREVTCEISSPNNQKKWLRNGGDNHIDLVNWSFSHCLSSEQCRKPYGTMRSGTYRNNAARSQRAGKLLKRDKEILFTLAQEIDVFKSKGTETLCNKLQQFSYSGYPIQFVTQDGTWCRLMSKGCLKKSKLCWMIHLRQAAS